MDGRTNGRTDRWMEIYYKHTDPPREKVESGGGQLESAGTPVYSGKNITFPFTVNTFGGFVFKFAYIQYANLSCVC